jgi:hypothetical protein
MKKIIFTLLIIHCSLIIANAQWQADVRLTNDTSSSYTSYNNARCIATSGNAVHVVWYDERDGNYEIYYKRSTDGGTSWGADTRLTYNSADSKAPSISVINSIVHVVWFDNRDGNYKIYYKRSTDGGTSWGEDTRLTNNPAYSTVPSISVSGSSFHIVWADNRDGTWQIYYKNSTNEGINWGADTRLTGNSSFPCNPSISVSGLSVHVVWWDYRDGPNGEIYHKRSLDGGMNWGADLRLTYNYSTSEATSVSVSVSFVHVVWHDSRDGGYAIYYKRSTDGGENWEADTRLSNNSTFSRDPSIIVSGLVVHVVWEDNRDGNSEIYYKRSTNGGVDWEADTRLTNNIYSSLYPFVSVMGSFVHVIWQEARDGNNEIYYKRNPTGNSVGIIKINSIIPKEYKLEQNYPNPFNPTTKIKFDIKKEFRSQESEVKLIIYDILGRKIEDLVNEKLQPGSYEITFDGANLPSGIYFYQLKVGEFVETKKLVLLK